MEDVVGEEDLKMRISLDTRYQYFKKTLQPQEIINMDELVQGV